MTQELVVEGRFDADDVYCLYNRQTAMYVFFDHNMLFSSIEDLIAMMNTLGVEYNPESCPYIIVSFPVTSPTQYAFEFHSTSEYIARKAELELDPNSPGPTLEELRDDFDLVVLE